LAGSHAKTVVSLPRGPDDLNDIVPQGILLSEDFFADIINDIVVLLLPSSNFQGEHNKFQPPLPLASGGARTCGTLVRSDDNSATEASSATVGLSESKFLLRDKHNSTSALVQPLLGGGRVRGALIHCNENVTGVLRLHERVTGAIPRCLSGDHCLQDGDNHCRLERTDALHTSVHHPHTGILGVPFSASICWGVPRQQIPQCCCFCLPALVPLPFHPAAAVPRVADLASPCRNLTPMLVATNLAQPTTAEVHPPAFVVPWCLSARPVGLGQSTPSSNPDQCIFRPQVFLPLVLGTWPSTSATVEADTTLHSLLYPLSSRLGRSNPPTKPTRGGGGSVAPSSPRM
jgi:hypothetical protein